MTTNQPTQPDMFEPPEKFGNYLADKSLAAFNQPTDATRFKTALYAQCPEPVADDIWQRFESLTLQLATAQAQAKALEAWVSDVYTRLDETDCDCSPADDYVCEMCKVLYQTPKPQPVDASSLARIARYVQTQMVYEDNRGFDGAGGDEWFKIKVEYVRALEALTDTDRALAQALAGGA